MTNNHNAGAVAHREPEPIKAIPVRHPWRAVFAAVVLVAVVLFLWDAAFNRPVYSWDVVAKYLFDVRILSGIGYTLQLTVYAMVIGVALGVTMAVMRMSPNPVMRYIAWVFLWLFRGTPVYVQLVMWGMVPVIYKTISLGIPFTEAVFEITTKDVLNYFVLAVIGLALNEAAYMAEIVRAGLMSVDKGQNEAAIALGLGWWHTMSRIVLPQAMRVIIPPTGNELISMLKTTSLVVAVPFTLDLYSRARDIAAVNYKPVPLLIVASLWYLLVTSILMVGQYYLERHFAKGIGERPQVQQPTVETGAISVIGTSEDHALLAAAARRTPADGVSGGAGVTGTGTSAASANSTGLTSTGQEEKL